MKVLEAGKTRMIGLPYSFKNYDNILSRFHTILERNVTDGRTDGLTDRRTDGQTDRQTDRIATSISLTRD